MSKDARRDPLIASQSNASGNAMIAPFPKWRTISADGLKASSSEAPRLVASNMEKAMKLKFTWGVCLTVAMVVATAGCREHMPHSGTWPATGDEIKTHPKPPEGGYYSDWDPYAGTIELIPAEDVNPVKTQHVLIATVRDKDGKPLPNRRVEWIIADGSVGDIVEVDESGWRASRGMKVTNKFAISHTNNFNHVLTRGNDDPSDDITLEPGQTWCVITSPIEGDTHITAYAPGIFNWDKHKVFAVKHWYDVAWEWPPPAQNPTGTPHDLETRVYRISDGTPLANYIVNYKLVDGPPGSFQPSGTETVTTKTDGAGIARAVLTQVQPQEGLNNIQIDIIRPADEKCCKPARHIATGGTTKQWIAPKITIDKDAPEFASLGEQFVYNVVVTNPSTADALDVSVSDPLPLGVEYISANPPAEIRGNVLVWNFDKLSARRKRSLTVNVRAIHTGRYTNCAEVTASQGLSARDCADTEIIAPQLALELQCIGEAIPCDVLPYSVRVSNPGDAPATNVVVNAQLPPGLLTETGRSTMTFDAGTLEPGQSKRAHFNVKAATRGNYPVRAIATGEGNLRAEAACTTVIRQPELMVTKTGPEKRYLGRPATFEITVMNRGDAPARDVMLTDVLPPGMVLTQASDGPRHNGGELVWRLGTLNPDASKTVTVTVQCNESGVFRNDTVARAYCTEAKASATTDVEGIAAVLLEVIDKDDPIEVGQNETYEIVVTNQGSADATNVVINCYLPPQQEFVAAHGPTEATNTGPQISFAPAASVPPGGKLVYRVTVKGKGTGDVRFRATMTTDQTTSPVEETESTHIY